VFAILLLQYNLERAHVYKTTAHTTNHYYYYY